MPKSVQDYFFHHDNLLQQYRAISITTQAFLLTIAAIVADNERAGNADTLVFAALFAGGLFHIHEFWSPIVAIRGHVVNFYKFQVEATADQLATFQTRYRNVTDGEFAKDPELRAEICKLFGRSSEAAWPDTRHKMDVGLPRLFVLGWFVLLVLVLTP